MAFSSASFSAFTMLCNHHSYLVPKWQLAFAEFSSCNNYLLHTPSLLHKMNPILMCVLLAQCLYKMWGGHCAQLWENVVGIYCCNFSEVRVSKYEWGRHTQIFSPWNRVQELVWHRTDAIFQSKQEATFFFNHKWIFSKAIMGCVI